jgi:hypothetical protein
LTQRAIFCYKAAERCIKRQYQAVALVPSPLCRLLVVEVVTCFGAWAAGALAVAVASVLEKSVLGLVALECFFCSLTLSAAVVVETELIAMVVTPLVSGIGTECGIT